MPLLVLYNPVCGSRSSKSFTEEHIIPLLEQHNIAVDSVLATEYPGHAGALVADYLKRSFADLTVILASGDGTLHEIINNYTPLRRSPSNDHQVLITPPQISLVLVPTGTANALYSSLFPPTKNEDILSVTTFLPPSDSQVQERTVVSAVVTSTSAHASILHDSEELRKEFPGIERFEVAAQRNSKRWYNATAKLFPSSLSGAVQIYKPISRQFINHPEWATEKPVVELKGPFIYFLSTVNVDRLEPEFRITPLARTLPSKGATYDIVIVRPLRDPSNARADDEARAQYVDKIWKVMRGAYADGTHINLRYDQEGRVVSEGDGPLVVEYIRCGGWEWLPGDDDERAPLVCADGDILTIERGGKVVSFASTPSADTGFAVYG